MSKPVAACAQTDPGIAAERFPFDPPPCDCECQACHDGRVDEDSEGERYTKCPDCGRPL